MSEHTYEVRVTGLLPTIEVLEDLGEVEMAGHDVTTVLSGEFVDQAALSAFLRRLRAHGLEVVEIRRVVEDEPPAGDAAAEDPVEDPNDKHGDKHGDEHVDERGDQRVAPVPEAER